MYRNPRLIALFTLTLLILSACDVAPLTAYPAEAGVILATPMLLSAPCADCDQATLSAALTQQRISAENQFMSTAEVLRAGAQATLNSANATLNAAQTQSQGNANFLAAQVAATAEIARANAQATLYSAGSTQSAAQTQSQYDLQVTQAVATQNAEALMTQQYQNALAAGTQTAIADNIATQTQAAAATSQWYADQERQRKEERQAPITFLWTWCLPVFIVLFAALALWGFWSWMKSQQARQAAMQLPVAQLPESIPQHIHALPYVDSEVMDSDKYQVTTPDDQVPQWLDEVKDQLQQNDEKDEHHDTDH